MPETLTSQVAGFAQQKAKAAQEAVGVALANLAALEGEKVFQNGIRTALVDVKATLDFAGNELQLLQKLIHDTYGPAEPTKPVEPIEGLSLRMGMPG